MDNESKTGSGGFPSNGIIAIVVVVAGVLFVREAPLETTRLPVNEAHVVQHHSMQDVDARLWQDPLTAVAKYRAEARKEEPKKLEDDDNLHSAKGLLEEVAKQSKGGRHVEVLAVMLPGGPYSENVESRRRGRYAVLAALNASRLSPDDTEHLGYFLPDSTREPIPYEWFLPSADVTTKELSKMSLQSRVLVLWLQTEAFATTPLKLMAERAKPFIESGASWRVLGPNGSDGLKDMIDEDFNADPADQTMKQMHFYSLYATVPDDILLRGQSYKHEGGEGIETASNFLKRKGISLVRTIGDDGTLAKALIAELKLRGLNPQMLPKDQDDDLAYQESCRTRHDDNDGVPSQIAVVAEWDTLYGRSLLREFRARRDVFGFCVQPFNYVRGLDGQLPVSGDSASSGSDAPKQAQPDKDPGRRKDGTYIEVAEGQGQFDYLRRLAIQMHMKDAQVRRMSGDGHGFRAIGVLGNDVHDKLTVLQALRPEFPDVIFFTTDMDARFLHPREQAWTRNLIVASNFGLRLTDSLQGTAPPFRDSYQVSSFLSTRLALEDARREMQLEQGASEETKAPLPQAKVSKWFKNPRIFEIGRTTAFDFTGPWPRGMDRPKCRGRGWRECDDIHPAGSRLYPSPGVPLMFVVFSVLVLLLWVPPVMLSRGAKAWVKKVVATRQRPVDRWLRWGALAVVLLCLQVALPLGMARSWEPFAAWLTRDGKPMVAIEGISPWPTEAIRVFTLLLCFHLLHTGWVLLSDNLDEISEKFGAIKAREDLNEQQNRAEAKQSGWRKLLQMFSMRFIVPLHRQPGVDHGMKSEAVDFWGGYIVQNRLTARLVRTGACVVIAGLLSLLLILAVGDNRFVPRRGEFSLPVHEWLRIPAVLLMYFLVFFVVDATVLCVRFVRGLLDLRRLHDHAPNWPEDTLKKFQAELGMPRAYLENWIDLQFIALRTASVTKLIYLPFIVISSGCFRGAPSSTIGRYRSAPCCLRPSVRRSRWPAPCGSSGPPRHRASMRWSRCRTRSCSPAPSRRRLVLGNRCLLSTSSSCSSPASRDCTMAPLRRSGNNR